MSAPIEPIELRNTLDLVQGAIQDLLVSWNEGEHTVEPYKLLDALTQLEVARGTLARLLRDAENANDSDVRATVAQTDDDEVLRTARKTSDDPVALAKAMQQKRHGASP